MQRAALGIARVEREAEHRVGARRGRARSWIAASSCIASASSAGLELRHPPLVGARRTPRRDRAPRRAAPRRPRGRGPRPAARGPRSAASSCSSTVALTRSRLAVSIRRVTDLPTPLEEAPPDAVAAGRPLFLKREDVHELGAFKWRGRAARRSRSTAPAARTPWSPPRPATTARPPPGRPSAPACGRWCSCRRARARRRSRCWSSSAPSCTRSGSDLDEAKDAAREHATANDLPFFEDGAEPAQFDGYEAIGEEILEQLGQPPATVIVPVGNGALLIGVGRRRSAGCTRRRRQGGAR